MHCRSQERPLGCAQAPPPYEATREEAGRVPPGGRGPGREARGSKLVRKRRGAPRGRARQGLKPRRGPGPGMGPEDDAAMARRAARARTWLLRFAFTAGAAGLALGLLGLAGAA